MTAPVSLMHHGDRDSKSGMSVNDFNTPAPE
jgi:hypothetical protein